MTDMPGVWTPAGPKARLAHRKETAMLDVSFVLLYVDNPSRSAAFYGDLLGRPPVESSPTFAMFAMSSGLMLGLWSRHTVEPAAAGAAGSAEIAFTVADRGTVDATHEDWSRRGLEIVQTPTDLDFGRTFVALDPDGHRLRVFTPSAQ
jgi:catechol 2,3-dioxygenase-like lactoylglutathione lyase family enzyme